MSKRSDYEERLRLERLELLKMKQGIIEESEIIPEDEKAVVEAPRGVKKFTNFIYHNAWILVPALFAAGLAAFLIVGLLTREAADLKVFLAVTDEKNQAVLFQSKEVEELFERYCPDFDGNGKVHVEVATINMTLRDEMVETADVERRKASLQLEICEAMLALVDEGYISWYLGEYDTGYPIFTDFSGELPAGKLIGKVGVTDEKIPQGFAFCLRALPQNKKGEEAAVIERRARAETVLKNIIDNNVLWE